MFLFSIFLVASFMLTYAIKYIAIKKSLIDIPNDRSSHTIPTPRGGGLAIAIVWFIGLVYFYATNQITSNLFYALLPGVAISAISFLDDIFTKLENCIQSSSLPRDISRSRNICFVRIFWK